MTAPVSGKRLPVTLPFRISVTAMPGSIINPSLPWPVLSRRIRTRRIGAALQGETTKARIPSRIQTRTMVQAKDQSVAIRRSGTTNVLLTTGIVPGTPGIDFHSVGQR